MAWPTSRIVAPAAELHARPISWSHRSVAFCEVTRPALVLGSTQPATDVDTAAVVAAGVDVVRRRSGGGAVLVEPGRLVWSDVIVPAGDPLWQPDVGRSFWWLGEVWAAALESLGATGAAVHRGRLVTTRWSPKVCFAGLGPGEVTVGGGKVVGMSQRRVREGALLQCAVVLAWDPVAIPGLLALPPDLRAALEAESPTFTGTLPGCTTSDVERALLSWLP